MDYHVIYGCWHRGVLPLFKEPSVFFQTKLPSISAYATQLSWAETQCPSFHHTCAGPQCGLIDFPLQCRRGGLFKHTFGDVLPHRARYPKAITCNTEEKIKRTTAPPRGKEWQLQPSLYQAPEALGWFFCFIVFLNIPHRLKNIYVISLVQESQENFSLKFMLTLLAQTNINNLIEF